MLAPMAGITNTAYRRLCREYGNGLFVSEMVTSRALVERTEESMRLIGHHESEQFRSVQLYGVDPTTISRAVKMLVDENRADHIDLNFGCPVAKVTRKGGGAALPWKHELFEKIVQAAVGAAGDIPVTVKMRKGIDSNHLTFLDAGKAARDAGVSAVALHGRTAEDFYSGKADWEAIAELRESLPDVQVLGNGDIWSAADAVSMMNQTGVDGIVVGRGCLGRPWLFQDLERAISAYIAGDKQPAVQEVMPTLGEVADAFYRHAELLTEFFEQEDRACRDIRKHVAWYFKGYSVGSNNANTVIKFKVAIEDHGIAIKPANNDVVRRDLHCFGIGARSDENQITFDCCVDCTLNCREVSGDVKDALSRWSISCR